MRTDAVYPSETGAIRRSGARRGRGAKSSSDDKSGARPNEPAPTGAGRGGRETGAYESGHLRISGAGDWDRSGLAARAHSAHCAHSSVARTQPTPAARGARGQPRRRGHRAAPRAPLLPHTCHTRIADVMV